MCCFLLDSSFFLQCLMIDLRYIAYIKNYIICFATAQLLITFVCVLLTHVFLNFEGREEECRNRRERGTKRRETRAKQRDEGAWIIPISTSQADPSPPITCDATLPPDAIVQTGHPGHAFAGAGQPEEAQQTGRARVQRER